jgi:uncharacterized DUF497 family protein
MNLQFEWDEDKAIENLGKHGISFDESITVFGDPYSITIYDSEHSEEEDRFIDIGRSVNGRIVVVVYTDRESCVRIISARAATRAERRHYEQG